MTAGTSALDFNVNVDDSRVSAWTAAVRESGSEQRALQVLSELARHDEHLGNQRLVLAEHAARVFDAASLCDPEVAASLVEDAARIGDEISVRSRRVAVRLSEFTHRELELRVRLIPGTRLCFRSSAGSQVFGMVAGATAKEACCFLEHTFYHELSDQWASPRTKRAESNRASSRDVITWILSLVRNEGVANLFCLDELRLMPASTPWRYFTYAPLIDRDDAALASITKLVEALRTVAKRDVEDATAFVNGTLKNPDLPMLNLAGLRFAHRVITEGGVSALADVCRAEPEDLVRAWLESADPLVAALAGDVRRSLTQWASEYP